MKYKFPVVEIFDSIEGEGKRTGYLSTFIRFAGCNLRCSYCDTAYALSADDAAAEYTADELAQLVLSKPWSRATLTGGEPMLQPLQELTERLCRGGCEVNIETNGAVLLPKERPAGLFYTMDWKSPSSGMSKAMKLENLQERLKPADVVKFVVATKDDLDDMAYTISHLLPAARPLLYVSPVWGEIEAAALVDFVKEKGLDDVCVQVQLHKIIYDPEARGV